ncbi:MAG: GPI mannosyltransferase 1 [Piccolia ochrophora]|nr:MAG: GPI mannosyltransferase 1 [Piccolia ochrophora]
MLQDVYSPIKYTDIDYFVFTDAARYVSRSNSPYDRDTYRYTPLLAWLLLPTAWHPSLFSFGKVLFALGDIVAGWLIVLLLRSSYGLTETRALKFASIWLLNPMVATISTRGSSEGLLCVLVVALLWAAEQRRIKLAGVLLGLSVHLKIYPFIYGASILWWLDERRMTPAQYRNSGGVQTLSEIIMSFCNRDRLAYGMPFVQHTYLHHATRIDHRHNFSPYNTILHIHASPVATSTIGLESIAFLPQLLLSTILIPLLLAKQDLASTMLAQTFSFVSFNKVCTSQYFLWYMVFLPLYLPFSSFVAHPRFGVLALALWILTQVIWLQQGYQLEFIGRSTFAPELWAASTMFFIVNVWVLGVVVTDVGQRRLVAYSPQVEKDRR